MLVNTLVTPFRYLSFADQREELLGRRKELDKGVF
jgi:hypothetical protein